MCVLRWLWVAHSKAYFEAQTPKIMQHALVSCLLKSSKLLLILICNMAELSLPLTQDKQMIDSAFDIYTISYDFDYQALVNESGKSQWLWKKSMLWRCTIWPWFGKFENNVNLCMIFLLPLLIYFVILLPSLSTNFLNQ